MVKFEKKELMTCLKVGMLKLKLNEVGGESQGILLLSMSLEVSQVV